MSSGTPKIFPIGVVNVDLLTKEVLSVTSDFVDILIASRVIPNPVVVIDIDVIVDILNIDDGSAIDIIWYPVVPPKLEAGEGNADVETPLTSVNVIDNVPDPADGTLTSKSSVSKVEYVDKFKDKLLLVIVLPDGILTL